MPTDDELTAYAAQLPPIYRDILAAFPEIEPVRTAGQGIAFPTLAMHFFNRGIGYGEWEIREACRQLASAGIVEIRNEIFVYPKPVGERLIAMLTGIQAYTEVPVPTLPRPNWVG